MQNFIKYVTRLLLIALLLPALAHAEDDVIHADPGIDTFRPSFSAAPHEVIDPFTGGLTLVYEDLRFPGNGGLDLVINRTYSSKKVYIGRQHTDNLQPTLLGYGWDIHFGRFKANGNTLNFELQDGIAGTAYRTTLSSSTYISTKDFWKVSSYSAGSLSNVLTLTDGTKITFGKAGEDDYYYATKISRHGNAIDIVYNSGGSHRIQYVTDTLGWRKGTELV